MTNPLERYCGVISSSATPEAYARLSRIQKWGAWWRYKLAGIGASSTKKGEALFKKMSAEIQAAPENKKTQIAKKYGSALAVALHNAFASKPEQQQSYLRGFVASEKESRKVQELVQNVLPRAAGAPVPGTHRTVPISEARSPDLTTPPNEEETLLARENISKAVAQTFADHVLRIQEELLKLWPQIVGKDLKSQKVAHQFLVGEERYTLKYRYREGALQTVIKQDLGEGAFKTVQKVLIVSGRTMATIEEPFAYAKLHETHQVGANASLEAEALCSQAIHEGLSSEEQANVLKIVQVMSLKNPSKVKALRLQLCESDAEVVAQDVGRRKYSLKDRLVLARCAANGLAHMHQKGFCHLDFKPANLLIRREASGLQGYVSDFGASAKVGTALSGGTLLYLPPTVRKGTQSTASFDIDLWSLGMSIVELLYGEEANPMEYPLWEDQFSCLCDYIKNSESSPLKELLLGLLDLDPSKRPSASDACKILDEVLAKMK